MSAEYQAFARGYIECGILEDGDYEENTMKPKIKIVTSSGLVTAITSEGSATDVEIVEEDTGKEVLFTSRDKGYPDALYRPAPPLEGTVTEQ